MDRLKAILADKILDLSSTNDSDVKNKLEKIQRFRDFAAACQTLMIKYPRIEDELIKMINDGDFDTKVASSRVDSIIRLADSDTVGIQVLADKEVDQIVEEEDAQLIAEDIEEQPLLSEKEEEGEYVAYQEIEADEPAPIIVEEVSLSEQEIASQKRKAIIRKVVQVGLIALAVVLLIIIIKFVLINWKTILIILGIVAILLIIVWFIRRKRQ